jgi:phosphatidylglycerol:prolipoprotein diacylglycerol transferase
MLLNYILWNASPFVFYSEFLKIRWYGLFFSIGFIIGPEIGRYIFKKEGRSVDELNRIVLYIMIGTMLGARLGHVLFYQPSMFLTNPIQVFLPIQFNPFKIIGYQGLASHGATIGIVLALYLVINYRFNISLLPFKIKLFDNNKRPGSYLWITTPAVIVIALAGGCIRLGNFMNSEIFGKPTESKYGVMFVRNVTDTLKVNYDFIKDVSFLKGVADESQAYQPITCQLRISKFSINRENSLKYFLDHDLINTLRHNENINKHIFLPEGTQVGKWYTIKSDKDGNYLVKFNALGIARHPSQLYEAFSCFILFFILFFIWKYKRAVLGDGEIAGIFLIYIFGLRFLYEFAKETKALAPDMALNIAHLLSIPAVLMGVSFLILGFKNRKS